MRNRKLSVVNTATHRRPWHRICCLLTLRAVWPRIPGSPRAGRARHWRGTKGLSRRAARESTRRWLRRIHDDEVVAVRHRDFGQGLRVHLVALADDAVEMEQVRRDGVHLIVGERLRLEIWHRATRVVEDRRRVWPVLPMVRTGVLLASVPCPPTSRSFGWPAPFAPWQAWHFRS